MGDFTLNLALVGDGGVGKTSVILRWIDDAFSDVPVATIGETDWKAKDVIVEGKKIPVKVWDTAGAERFQGITKSTFRRAQTIIVCYAVNDDKSFQHATNWIQEVKFFTDESVKLIIFGTKIDLDRKVTADEGQKLAQDHDAPFFECSSKTSKGINEAMQQVVEYSMKQMQEQERIESPKPVASTPPPQTSTPAPTKNTEPNEKASKADCCALL